MLFSIVVNMLLLGVVIFAFTKENPYDYLGPILVTAVAPPLAGFIPFFWFHGLPGALLSLFLSLFVLYILLRFLFDLSPRGALMIMTVYTGLRILLNFLLGLILAA